MNFKDFCKFQEGYVNPSQKKPEYFDGPIKWLRATDLNNSVVFNTSKTLSQVGFESAGKSAYLFEPNTLAISKSGTIGRLGILKDYMCGNRAVINIKVDETKMDSLYVFYWLLNNQAYIQDLAVGSVQKNLYVSALEKLEIKEISISEQKAIAKVLSDLDEKIEINNKINKKLEEMAQAIFKQWFVDFEFLNEDGKPYKSSGGEMVESELGMIPKGWKIGTFREFTDTVLGGDWGKETEQGNYKKEVLCLRGADIPEIKCGKIGAPAKRFILEKNYNNKKLNGGDLVVEISGGSPTQSTGRITYINEGILNRYDLDFVCTNFCRAITLNNKKAMEYFYFYWSYLYDLNVFFQYENGTTGIKNFDVNTFLDKHKIIIPPNYLLEKYHLIISNILNTIQHNGLENSKLSNTRDILLPKLMSGEIRVPID